MTLRLVVACLCFCILSLSFGGRPHAADDRNRDFSWAGLLEDDLFAAGRSVNIAGSIEGDAFLAGGAIRAEGSVSDSLIAAGGRIRVAADVGDDVIATGGLVDIAGSIGDGLIATGGAVAVRAKVAGRVVATGGEVEVERGARVGGGAWLTGGTVKLDGDVAGDVRLAGGEMIVNGHVAGDVDARGGTLRIGETARIDGDIRFRGKAAPIIAPGATVGGEIAHDTSDLANKAKQAGRFLGGAMNATYYVFLVLFGLILIAATPRFAANTRSVLAESALLAFGVGALVLLVIPAAIVVLVLTLIGIPLALGVLSLYLLLLFLSMPFFAAALARGAAERFGKAAEPSRAKVFLFYLGLLVALWFIDRVPILDNVVWALCGALGIGIATIQIYRAFRSARARSPTPA